MPATVVWQALIMADALCNAATFGVLDAARRPVICVTLQEPDLLQVAADMGKLAAAH